MSRASKLNAQFAENPAFEAGKTRAQSYLRIGSELKKLRERENLTQMEVAQRTGLDQADISRLEAGVWGKRGISYDVLGKLLPVFGLRISHEVKPLEEYLQPTDSDNIAKAEVITELLHADQ